MRYSSRQPGHTSRNNGTGDTRYPCINLLFTQQFYRQHSGSTHCAFLAASRDPISILRCCTQRAKIDSSKLHGTPHAYIECRNTPLFLYKCVAQSIGASCVRWENFVCVCMRQRWQTESNQEMPRNCSTQTENNHGRREIVKRKGKIFRGRRRAVVCTTRKCGAMDKVLMAPPPCLQSKAGGGRTRVSPADHRVVDQITTSTSYI